MLPSVLILNPKFPAVEAAIPVFKSKRAEPIVEAQNLDEAAQTIAEGLCCVVVYCMTSENEIPALMQFCKAIALDKKAGYQRVVIVTNLDNQKTNSALLNKSISEIFNTKIQPKTLVFKIAFLLGQLQRLIASLNDEVAVKSGGVRRASDVKAAADGPAFLFIPDTSPHDFWSVRGKDPRKIGVQWVIEADGPDVDSGAWETAGLNENRIEQWCWHFFDEDGQAKKLPHGTPAWTFAGNRPAFDPAIGRWKFIAAKPEFFSDVSGKKTFHKVKTDTEKGIVISADNPNCNGVIDESKMVGELIRKKRERQVAERAKSIEGSDLAARETAPTASNAGVIIQKGNRGDLHTAVDKGHTGEMRSAVQSAVEAAPSSYELTDAVGTLRSTKQDVPLGRVPSEEFGNPSGIWEPVKNSGWAFITPDIEASSPARLNEKAPFWTLEKSGNEPEPYYDQASSSWLFTKNQKPERTETFADLPVAYQERFAMATKTRVDFKSTLERKDLRTQTTFESIRDLEERASKGSFAYFFKMSEMVTAGKPHREILTEATRFLGQLLDVPAVVIIQPMIDNQTRQATVVASTSKSLEIGRKIDLENTPYRNALTDTEIRLVSANTENVHMHPCVLDTKGKNVGCLLLFHPANRTEAIKKQDKFLRQVTKQISRLLAS